MRTGHGHGRLSAKVLAVCVALAGLSALPAEASATLRHGLGLAEPPHVANLASKVIRFAAGSPPASADLTVYAPPVGDQGQVNSCAAWATDYTALGYWENRQGIAGGVLAPMYTYAQVTGGRNLGTAIESHLGIASAQGVDNAADYPQTADRPAFWDYWDQPSAAQKTHAVSWKVTGYTPLDLSATPTSTVTQQSIEQAVAAGQPVVIGIPVYDNFMNLGPTNHGYYAGISGPYDGGHAITVLGYDATGVRIENSWGTGWGDSGFATLSWAFVNQYVMDAVAVGQLVATAPVTTPPANSAPPVITGSAASGQTLTASPGTWAPSGTSTTARWQRSPDGQQWADIGGAGMFSYTIQPADTATYLRVIVTESNGYGQSSATSAPVGPITAGPPQNVAPPVLSPAPRIGGTVTADPGVWSPAATSFAYAWQYSADGRTGWVSIPGAHSASFTVTDLYSGTYLRLRVTATNSAGEATAFSGPAGPVSVGAPVNTARPATSGSARIGVTLTASSGRWSPSGRVTFAWQRSTNGGASWSTIAGATGSRYTITSADAGASLRARVTATNSAGSTSVTTAALGPVRRSVALHVSRARISLRTVSFSVALDGVAGQPRATAVRSGRSVRLHATGAGTHFTFSGRLSRGRWVVTVKLVSGHTSFVVVIKR